MKSLIKFIVILAGITTIATYFLNFNSSGDIAKDCGTAVEDGINKIKSTTTQAATMVKTLTQTDSLQSVKNPEQETKN